ncbi:MAG: 1-acyl-sn-glycerol-3-phosphate acyltransferase [Methylococcales bacterium]|nr:1-acyl-sn-glycerol-3-phosphate acyltransferase [Methylococcales bacterium]
MLKIKPGSSLEKEKRVQYAIHKAFQLFFYCVQFLGLMKKEVYNQQPPPLNEAMVIVANHPTLIDVVMLLSIIPHATCVVKHQLKKNFFLRGVVTSAGYITNTDGSTFLENCVEKLQQGHSLIIFPEGTRSPENTLGKFKRGAARIAISSQTRILPCLIQCSPPTLMKHQKWYCIPQKPFTLSIEFLEPISTEQYYSDTEEKMPIYARNLTEILREFFLNKGKRNQ